MSKRRQFTPEFKAQVVLEELTGVKEKAEVCRDYRLIDEFERPGLWDNLQVSWYVIHKPGFWGVFLGLSQSEHARGGGRE